MLSLTMAAYADRAKSGKKVELARADFRIVGTSCADCLMTAERLLSRSSGVKKARVMLVPPYVASVIFNARKTSVAKLVRKLEKRDFQIKDLESRQLERIPEEFKPEHSSLKTAPSAMD